MINFSSIQDSGTRVIFHPKPKGIIQFIGGFPSGSFPEFYFKYLFQYLYEKDYSLIAYRFPFNPFQFEHWPVAIDLLENLYKVRVQIVKKLLCNKNYDQLEFYASDTNYFWLGYSLGCKYVLLLEALSDDQPQRRDEVLKSQLRKQYLPKAQKDIKRADKIQKNVTQTISDLLGRSCEISPFIRDQPSLLVAPEILDTFQILNINFPLPSFPFFPNRDEVKGLISASTALFKLMGLVSFSRDGISRDDVDFLKGELQNRSLQPFLYQSLPGNHDKPQGKQIEDLVSCIDIILQELRSRQLDK